MMVKEGYKETLIGVFPESWQIKQTQEVGEIITGTTPKTSDEENFGGGYPFITPTDIDNKKYVKSTERFLSKKGYDVSRPIPKDTVVVTCIASIGKNALTIEESCTNQQINSIVCNKENDPNLIYYMINYRKKYLKALAGKTSVPIVNKGEFSTFVLPIPPKKEQKKIADILSSVDENIEKTDQVIEKTKELKKGLMQQLLTKGIGHDDFKESRIGLIPKDWKLEILKNVAQINMGSSPPSKSYNEKGDGLPFFQGNADFGYRFPNVTQWCNDPQKIANKKDILISVRAPVGELNIASYQCCIGRGLSALKGKKVESIFMYYYLNQYNNLLESFSQGSTFSAITKKVLESFPIAVPPMEEQKKIANILSTVDEKIKKEKEYKSKLEELKKGLMQKLLTGEVRVKVAN